MHLRTLVLSITVSAASIPLLVTSPASAATPPVGTGTAGAFAVLAGTTVTNTGPSVVNGDLGLSPGLAVSGFPPGTLNGVQHLGDAVALTAQNDLVTAYNDAAGRGPAVDQTGVDLGGQLLTPGVYRASSAMSLTGTVTLDGQGDPNAVFVFQAGSTLISASASTVALTGGAQACNVYWQVGSSATLGTTTNFVGTIMALTSATLQTGANLQGRVLARNGQVSLDTNVITRPTCQTPVATPSATPTPTPTSTPSTKPSTKPSPKPGNGPGAQPSSTGKPGTLGPIRTPSGASSPGASPTSSTPTPTATNGVPGSGAGPGDTDVIPSGRPDTGRTQGLRPASSASSASSAVPGSVLYVAATLLLGSAAIVVRVARRRPAPAGIGEERQTRGPTRTGPQVGPPPRAAWLAGTLATAGTVCLVLAAAQAAPTAPTSATSAGRGTAAPAAIASVVPGPATSRARSAEPSSVIPRRVEIAQIGVDTRLVELGLQDDGTVQVPQNPDLAGWFDLGPVPGTVGSAVILGHVDSVDGPAVFARLAQVRPGARIAVTLSDGRTERFTVRLVRTYANADFPARRVYGDHGHPALTLVTCGGAYDAARGGYQANVVVYAR